MSPFYSLVFYALNFIYTGVSDALSFFRFKTILDPSKFFWTGQKQLLTMEFHLLKNVQKDFSSWKVQNSFGPIEGQCKKFVV